MLLNFILPLSERLPYLVTAETQLTFSISIRRWATFYSARLDQKQQQEIDQSLDAQQEETGPCFVGIDIDDERIRLAMELLKQAQSEGHVHPSISISFHCANALESTHLFRNATVFFLYLIPRGLRIIKPLILSSSKLTLSLNPQSTTVDQNENDSERQLEGTTNSSSAGSSIRVATYMSPLPDENAILQERIPVEHHGDGAAWPIYVYELR
jgi:thymidylate synthase ThyX